VVRPGTHLVSQPELGSKWPGCCRDVGSALRGRMVALGLVPTVLQHGQSGPGSVVLLVPRRWQQTPAPKSSTRGQKSGLSGGFHPLLCLQTLHPGSHTVGQEPAAEQGRAIGRLTAAVGRTVAGTAPNLSHGCILTALVPRVPPSHRAV